MGTAIELSLNGIVIDWGKNRYWRSHYWLFPPGSLTNVRFPYADNAADTGPGFETTLGEACFRLCHLGYSRQEAETKFTSAVTRWNRTAVMHLTFKDFRNTLIDVDFASLTTADLKPYIWDFRLFLVDLLSAWDTEDAMLEEFVAGLDFTLILRVLADRIQSRPLPLRWHHQNLIDSGWATLEDLTDVDRQASIINHTMLVGRLQDYAEATTMKAFDKWLVQHGLPQRTPYSRLLHDGTVVRERTTLPTAVRNMIHHPENPHNALSDESLRDSIELLLGIAGRLPTPLPGLD